jgi:hypothetical protein
VFLKQVAAAWPRRQLQVICDNYATHKHPRVRAWLATHPRIQLHFTPTSASRQAQPSNTSAADSWPPQGPSGKLGAWLRSLRD